MKKLKDLKNLEEEFSIPFGHKVEKVTFPGSFCIKCKKFLTGKCGYYIVDLFSAYYLCPNCVKEEDFLLIEPDDYWRLAVAFYFLKDKLNKNIGD